jgi:hypothetical protein
MSGACAIIVCDHGLGHVRRCALMAKEREKTGEQVTLFAPRASVERLQRAVPSTCGLSVHDFATCTTPERVRQGMPEAVKWLERLPDLSEFDTVICDNLLEILALRPDATISAQFFWHDVIEGTEQDYAEYCEELLAQHKPKVIGCELFAMDAVRRQPGFTPVGLYKLPELVAAAETTPPEQRTDLLVTGGTTPAVRAQLQQVIDELLTKGPETYERVHVDPELTPEDAPDWMVRADFSVGMYRRLKAAVCRPGLGILTDLITVDSEISPLYESGNKEMQFNADAIKGKNVPVEKNGGNNR